MSFCGIKNISGNSCHVACAIQFTYYMFPDDAKASLLLLAKKLTIYPGSSIESKDYENFLLAFGNMIHQMKMEHKEVENSEVATSIYPTELYNQVSSRIDAFHVGDAASSLRSLLGMLRDALHGIRIQKESNCVWDKEGIISLAEKAYNGIHEMLWKGILTHQICGRKLIDNGNGNNNNLTQITRRKNAKKRPLPCPLPLPVLGYNSIESSVRSAIESKQNVVNYDWSCLRESEYDQEEEDIQKIQGISETVVSGLSRLSLDSRFSSTISNQEGKIEDRQEQKDGDTSVRNSSTSDDDSSSSSSDDSSSSSSDDSDSSSTSSSSTSSSSTSSTLSPQMNVWKTTKEIKPIEFPKILVLHLDRSRFVGGVVQKVVHAIEIPSCLNIGTIVNTSSAATATQVQCCHHNQNLEYELVGAIIHKDNIEEGHYLTYLKSTSVENRESDNSGLETWVKIDDDKVLSFYVSSGSEPNQGFDDGNSNPNPTQKVIPEKALLGMLGGRTKSKKHCATLLMYKLCCTCSNK